MTYSLPSPTSGLGPTGEASESAALVIATGTIGGQAAVAEDAARARKNVFVAIVGALAACLALAGLVFLRRGRKRGESAEDGEDSPAAHEQGEVPASDPQPPPVTIPRAARASAGPRGKICPTCGERFGAEAEFCGKDGTTLVLLN